MQLQMEKKQSYSCEEAAETRVTRAPYTVYHTVYSIYNGTAIDQGCCQHGNLSARVTWTPRRI